ncbi:MAG: PIG-L family deacetylase [Clostridia bacterium]|nr:PIG-L family deacetylase [Clostridia bacterium]
MKCNLILKMLLISCLCLVLFSALSEDTQEEFSVKAVFHEKPLMLKQFEPYALDGYISSNLPMSSVHCVIYDEIGLKNDYEKTVGFADPALEYPLQKLIDRYAFYHLSPGEKTLIITCESAGMIQEACRVRFTVMGVPDEPSHITSACKFTMSGNKHLLVQGNYSSKSCWKPASKDDMILITFPQTASSIRIDWANPPHAFLIECMNEQGDIVKTYDAGEEYVFYTDLFELGEDIKEAKITLSDPDAGICAIRVYGEITPRVDVPDFLPMPEKIDLMVVSAHQDDELLMFGGAVPYYTGSGKDVGIVYMTNCTRSRYQEALNGIWMTGVTYHPVFLGLADGHTNSVPLTYEYWNGKENTLSLIVEAIRKHKPDVIMTHGEQGEYGHNQHKTTSDAVILAVQAAADPKQFPESYEKYGAWQVKKAYRHEKGEGHIIMDWNVPMEAFDGRTPQQISEIAYFRHPSQLYRNVKFTLGAIYDYYGYTLIESTVGPDVIGGDFFENIAP